MFIESAAFAKSSEFLDQCPETGFAEIAFIGRSNVGKSSLINMLVDKRSLAKTSGTPGKTRLINHFIINEKKAPWYIVDLPGYGYAKISLSERAKWKKMIRTYLEERETLRCTMMLVDVRIEPQKIDLEFAKYMGEKGIPFAILFTKADRQKPAMIEKHVNAFLERLSEYFAEMPNVFLTSAEHRAGKEQLHGFMQSLIEA
ncbi:MAG: ribosome biogenesis GTP-binding protein YihA/YsxC [Flavobacteriales bacterium]